MIDHDGVDVYMCRIYIYIYTYMNSAFYYLYLDLLDLGIRIGILKVKR